MNNVYRPFSACLLLLFATFFPFLLNAQGPISGFMQNYSKRKGLLEY